MVRTVVEVRRRGTVMTETGTRAVVGWTVVGWTAVTETAVMTSSHWIQRRMKVLRMGSIKE
jgi:hypothetical protein